MGFKNFEMDKIRKALKTMSLVRIIAMVLLLAAVILYFTQPAYAMYPAMTGFIMIAFINLPLNFWVNRQLRRSKEGNDKS